MGASRGWYYGSIVKNGHSPVKPGFEPKSAQDAHLLQVMADPEFRYAVTAIKEFESRGLSSDEQGQAMRERLAEQYSIPIASLNQVMLPLHIDPTQKTVELSFETDTGKGTISFDITTSRAELIEEWRNFEAYRRRMFPVKQTRRKPPENPQLLYAIFKARRSGRKFPDIFRAYSAGNLDDYRGSSSQFSDEDSFEAYFHKYYPKNP
jgi:hypothetical protein